MPNTSNWKTTHAQSIGAWASSPPIPIQPGTKRPAINWKDALTWDDAKYKQLEDDPRAEHWGVGIVTAGLAVLDVDAAADHKTDADGITAFQRLNNELGELPPTYTNTARGADSRSRHYLFRLPEQYQGKKLHSPAPGIDLRTDGGQILVWPSKHPDTQTSYQWYDEQGKESGAPDPNSLPELPEAWCEKLATPQSKTPTRQAPSLPELLKRTPNAPTEGTCGYVNTAYRKWEANPQAKGSRHDTARDAIHKLAPTRQAPSLPELLKRTPNATTEGTCGYVNTAYRKWEANPQAKGSRHDTARDAIHKLALAHHEGHKGAIQAIHAIQEQYPPMVADSRAGGLGEALREVQGMIDGVADAINSTPARIDPCTTYTSTPAMLRKSERETVGFTMTELMDMQFKPIQWLIPELLAMGTILLVAPPKKGKSWLALELAYQIAIGGKAFGTIPVPQRPVLYMALEDGPRRLQGRLRTLDCTRPTDQLRFITATADIAAEIERFLTEHADHQPLVILDTLAKYTSMFATNPTQNAYERDYSIVG